MRHARIAWVAGIVWVLGCASGDEVEPSKNIVLTVAEQGSFKTLVDALESADIDETLHGPGPYTLFAPTDAAFGKLPPGDLEGLTGDPSRLKEVLKYHIVPGQMTSHDLQSMDSALTLNGREVTIRVQDGRLYIDDALVERTDIFAENGVIHVIDTVLQPGAEAD